MVNVNTCELTFRTKPFRAYSRATEGGGAVVKSTSSGGGTTATSSSGGGVSRSTASGGGTSRTSSAGGDHRHRIFTYQRNASGESAPTRAFTPYAAANTIYLQTSMEGDLYTATSSGNHTHNITFPDHTHDFNVPNHTHNVTIPNHRHDVEIPNHTHAVKHEINELSTLPTSVTIKVDGNVVPHTSIQGDRINLVDYMDKDNNGKITRGRHEVEITPNRLGRIEADVILRVFIQSQIGGVF